jgi:hypothetical protein
VDLRWRGGGGWVGGRGLVRTKASVKFSPTGARLGVCFDGWSDDLPCRLLAFDPFDLDEKRTGYDQAAFEKTV